MFTTDALASALAGRYGIERLVGEGGMARVYLARDLRHNRQVALKVLRPDLGAVVGVDRFQAEIQVTANLQHPNLLPLFDSGAAGDLLFYVMPFVEGESLRARLDREKQLPVDEAVRIATAIAAALDYAHRKGVVHRDLKPENILIQEGQPLVADFGIALAISNAGGARITQTGLSLGTPQYMSPEQATGDRAIDGRTDIYSLGAVLYEMLAGEPPHTGGTAQAIIARLVTETPRGIRATRPSVPEHVEAAIDRALEKVPADRFASAKAFSDALANENFSHSTSLGHARSATRLESRRTWNVRELGGWLVAAVVLAGFAWYATRKAPVATAGRFAVQFPDSVALGLTGTSHGRIALSRDGSALVIVGRNQATRVSKLYLRRANDPVAMPIRGTEDAESPSFSPSGDAIVFATRAGLLQRVPVAGGTPQTLATVKEGTPSYSSWGDDGTIIYQVDIEPAGTPRYLMAVSANGGDSRVVATTDTAKRIFQLRQPELLPGSKYALVSFLRGARTANSAPDSIRLGVISMADGSLTDLGLQGAEPHYVAPGYVVFNHGSVVMAAPFSLRKRSFTGPPIRILDDVAGVNAVTADFAVSQNGWLAYQGGGGHMFPPVLWVLDLRGVGRPLETESKALSSPAISPDGKRIALAVPASKFATAGDNDIWIMDLASGALRPLTVGGGNAGAVWSPDGSKIYYVKNRGTLLVRASSGAGAESTAVDDRRVFGFAPGPARGYSVIRTPPPKSDLLIAPTESLTAARPFVTTPVTEALANISPNGRWVAYMSDASGPFDVVVRALPGPGAEIPVSAGGGENPRWSPDGKTLYYRAPRHVMAARIVEQPQFAVVKRDTLFVDTYARGPGNEFSVFPNGRELLMVQRPQAKTELFMVVNWQQLLAAAPTSRP